MEQSKRQQERKRATLNSTTNMDNTNFAVLGTGGIGRRTLEVSQDKDNLTPVAACDRHGVAIEHDGLDVDELLAATQGNIASDGAPRRPVAPTAASNSPAGTKAWWPRSRQHRRRRRSMTSSRRATQSTPCSSRSLNFEYDFIPRVADRFAEADYEGILVDVLKRSRVIDMLDDRTDTFEDAGITFVCGAGATPGFLTGAAALAAQSFVEVEEVEIWWGVGLKSGYKDNRGTVREDIAHLDSYTIEDAREMSDEDIEAVINEHDGVIEFENMEHADDVLLERAGICDAEDVTVGGILDLTSDEKPTTTTVSVTGKTFDGETGTNTFQLDDNTSMEANVNGPALGYLKAGIRRNRAGEYGVFGPADLMPGY